MRSGCLKSAIAAPSRRNSGFEATENSLNSLLAQDRLDLVARPDRNGGLGHNDRARRHHLRKLLHGLENERQVGMPVTPARGCPDCDEYRLGIFDTFAQILRESEPTAVDIRFHQRFETRLPNRHLALVEAVDLCLILIDAADLVSEVGKTGSGDEPHIPCADHRDAHSLIPFGDRAGLSRRTAQ